MSGPPGPPEDVGTIGIVVVAPPGGTGLGSSISVNRIQVC